MQYANGDVYEGEWHNDKQCGKGKITKKIEISLEIEGNWYNNQILNKEKINFLTDEVKI